ncbi:unnamed protein product [Nezara viridula]|uniref:Uncharacterized protein n=1 Tax=Nezara viridula TaxID=85310 RepID=A0A9P0HD90_NEZVI|nr:unnamed protein product [Nezara viridula]
MCSSENLFIYITFIPQALFSGRK